MIESRKGFLQRFFVGFSLIRWRSQLLRFTRLGPQQQKEQHKAAKLYPHTPVLSAEISSYLWLLCFFEQVLP